MAYALFYALSFKFWYQMNEIENIVNKSCNWGMEIVKKEEVDFRPEKIDSDYWLPTVAELPLHTATK